MDDYAFNHVHLEQEDSFVSEYIGIIIVHQYSPFYFIEHNNSNYSSPDKAIDN